jgi:cytochrome c-type biogenesis protein CcmF
MMTDLGEPALVLALIVSLLQAAFAFAGAAKGNARLMRCGRGLALAAFALTLFAFAALMHAHVTDDFSLLNVAMTSHTQKPLLYKITGTWASHEGSMLLWVLILTGFGAALASFVPAMPLALRARALGVQALTGIGFFSFILFTSDPFTRLFPVPAEGNDLNPILQDPGLAFHPPFLYLGYVGFSSVFALAAALLLTKDADARWTDWLRPWALAAWAALTMGIALGSWWSYYELGWGGWWFWDPVENAALMPWLAGTAMIHSLMAARTRGALLRWTILLSILTFSLSLLGTFLVRSGILTSVHAFAVDPQRGVFVLALLAIAVGGALTLYALRAPQLPESPLFQPISREGALLLNNLFLCTACVTLMTGTLYPLILQAFGNDIVSVGPPYFNATVVPLCIPALVLMVVGPFLRWEKAELRPVLQRLGFAALLAVIALVAGLYLYGFTSALGLGALMIGVWIVAGTIADAARAKGAVFANLPRLLAHGGIGIAILGMAGSAFSQEYVFAMKPHDVADAGGYRLQFEDVAAVSASNYDAQRATFHLTKGSFSATLYPEQRFYATQGMALSHVAIQTNFICDLYLAIGDEQDDGAGHTVRVVRFHINPLVPWIWFGGAIMAAGAVMGAVMAARKGRKP